jgi:tetratricopeptide (TPR) repeat protein
MSDSDLKDTQPTGTLRETQPNSPASPTKRNFPRWLVALCVIALIAVGILTGYSSGMGQRYAAQDTLVTVQLEEQFQLGKQAMAAGNYELAMEYYKFIIRTDSNFPGIQTAYTDLLLLMQVSPTPVFSPTPLISPTPDLRGAEEIYNTALQLLNAGDWNEAITNLDSLRKTYPTYRVTEVDGMYYMALHQRGIDKIIAGCQNVNLEGGIYDLTLAEHFVGTGNLDAYAESLRTYARLYIIAASFWDQDWLQAQYFFAQVMDQYPSMSDSSCMNATRRWVEATLKVADQLLATGDNCGASDQYATAFMVNDPYNATAYPNATRVANQCNGGGGGGEDGGVSESPTAEGTPTVVGTPTVIEIPTDTPMPTTDSSPTCDPSSGTPCP